VNHFFALRWPRPFSLEFSASSAVFWELTPGNQYPSYKIYFIHNVPMFKFLTDKLKIESHSMFYQGGMFYLPETIHKIKSTFWKNTSFTYTTSEWREEKLQTSELELLSCSLLSTQVKDDKLLKIRKYELYYKTSTVKLCWNECLTACQIYSHTWWFSFFERKVKNGFNTQEVAF
jgi:hypothetical protein